MLEAVSSVPQQEAAELWMVGFRMLQSLSVPLDGLAQQLVKVLSGSAKGPLRVSSVSASV